LFANELKNYRNSINVKGVAEGHNAWFKQNFPNDWLIVADRQTPEVSAMINAQREQHEQFVQGLQQAAIDKYNQQPAGVSGDTALSVINAKNRMYMLLRNTLGVTQWENPNNRITRYIQQYVRPTFGIDEDLYRKHLERNNRTFMQELQEWEKSNPYQFKHDFVIDTTNGTLTREWQPNSAYFAYRVPTSGYILGRFYVDQPGDCYLYDNDLNRLYDLVQYGRNVPPAELQKGKYGYYYEVKQ
jgi:hypothetical protein